MLPEEKQTRLKGYHTKHLLLYLNHSRACGGWYSPWDGDDGFSTDELKAELATRPHVPNKVEGKALRRAASLKGR